MRKKKFQNFIATILIMLAVTVISIILFQPKLENLGAAKIPLPTPSSASDLDTPTPTPSPIESPFETPKGKFYAPILVYHHIAAVSPQQSYYVSPEIFDSQMKWLKNNNYTVISFEKFYQATQGKAELPTKPVILTFDDGNKDNYTNAVPILKKYNYPAMFFIKLNNLGKGGLTNANLKEMTSDGFEIGSHSVNHDNMANMDAATLAYELSYSKKYLEQNVGVEIKFFSYPGGAYSKKTIEAARATGYVAAVTTRHDVYQNIRDQNSLFTLPRVHIDDEMPTFMEWVQGKNLN